MLGYFLYDYYQGTESDSAPVYAPPQYTADQVIYIASAHSPSCGGITISGQFYAYIPSWSAEYQGNGTWLVQKTCLHYRTGFPVATYMGGSWYFYEANGELRYK